MINSNVLQVFPTNLFEFQVQENALLLSLLEEIDSKKDQISLVSSTSETQSVDNYKTDYSCPVELQNFEKIFDHLKEHCESRFGIKIKLCEYWTAIYKNGSFHQKHVHNFTILDEINYSGILYLTNHGETIFYNSSLYSYENIFKYPSRLGNIILFPASMVHEVECHIGSENERYVVPFNINMSHIK